MSIINRSMHWFTLLAVASFGVAAVVPNAIAQETDIDPLASPNPTGADALDGGDFSDPFEFIHRAILAPTVSGAEFAAQQESRINSAASDFRQQQQEALRQQAATETEAIEVTEESVDAGDAL
ncbi:MAG: hypothetical protein HC812_20300 [Leptolyngbya sp. RL_3_1]|nr:hypothetical protein [Leptolyngbya sp. RL_3_1]